MEKYPSLVFVLDVHRDAVSDADGNQYKLVSAEEPHAAQMSFIMGNAYDGWQENLKLAIAIQQNLSADYPTLMRPITMLNYRYNQFVSPGAMLLEVGAAGWTRPFTPPVSLRRALPTRCKAENHTGQSTALSRVVRSIFPS